MPILINSSAAFYIPSEADIPGADATNDGSSSVNASGTVVIPVGFFNTTLPTLTNGQAGALQTDNRSRLRTTRFLDDVTYTETQLTAPGSTTIRSFNGYRLLSCSYTVASINTSIVIRLEARLTGSSAWVNIDPSQADTTITANGTYGFTRNFTVEDIRFVFVSESGGTAATIDVVFRVGCQ
jgi:hypothetical protein